MPETLNNKIKVALTVLLLAFSVVFAAGHAGAQDFGGAFDGMRDSKEPIQIEADRLEVIDPQGVAMFEGNVNVVQGTTILKTSRLKVSYARQGENTGAGGNVRKIEASGKVAVRSGDQAATADSAVVNMQSKTALLSGNVTVSQGSNIVTGCKLSIDLANNSAKLEPCGGAASGGRVKMLFTPGSAK